MAALLLAATVSWAAPPPISATVHPGAVTQGAVSLRIDHGLVSVVDGKYRASMAPPSASARLMIDGLEAPALVSCDLQRAVGQPQTLVIEEYVASSGSSSYGKTGLQQTHVLTDAPLEFVIDPSPSGDYMYEMASPDNSWGIWSCTVETL